jgi:hypothetical protein
MGKSVVAASVWKDEGQTLFLAEKAAKGECKQDFLRGASEKSDKK